MPSRLAVLLLAVACAPSPRWRAPDQPTSPDAELLFQPRGALGVFRSMYASEIPRVPMRSHLRPCCVFGAQVQVQIGPVPIPAYSIGNLIDHESLGRHVYDSGVILLGSRGDEDGFIHSENNGLVYTCRGGFIDTAHVRDYADWMILLGTSMARNLESGTEFELPEEGGRRRVVLRPVDRELVDLRGRRAIAIPLAQWLAFQLSLWHEIATWFGWSTIPIFSEKVSSFSPEDLYSNLLGARLAAAVASQRTARDESLYNRSLEEWIDRVLEYLGAAPADVAKEAMRSLDGLWWDSTARVPDVALVRRRNFDADGSIDPWLVPRERAGPKLKQACGADPSPLSIAFPDQIDGRVFREQVTLSIEVSDKLAAQAPFPALGRTITQDDFPAIIAVIREQNRALFGEDADRPR